MEIIAIIIAGILVLDLAQKNTTRGRTMTTPGGVPNAGRATNTTASGTSSILQALQQLLNRKQQQQSGGGGKGGGSPMGGGSAGPPSAARGGGANSNQNVIDLTSQAGGADTLQQQADAIAAAQNSPDISPADPNTGVIGGLPGDGGSVDLSNLDAVASTGIDYASLVSGPDSGNVDMSAGAGDTGGLGISGYD